MANLYIVPTPIGNLEDITLRALRILRESDLIVAEDTRTTRVLLNHYDIKTSLQSYHKFNEHGMAQCIAEYAAAGKKIALVSDAGTPCISDPGFLLVRECLNRSVAVECLPGASALIPALAASGLPCERFCFEGFLPQKKGRHSRIQTLALESRTMVIYESPHRIVKLLTELSAALGGERHAVISRELTKIHEEILRGTIAQLLEHFSSHAPRGEFVVIVQGCTT
jgi:16S rRNA (cytidine1402-2'-O)-methyltransferase